MAGWALAFLGIFGLLGVGMRAFVQYRRTGSTGIVGASGEPGSAEWLGGMLFGGAWALLALGALLDAWDVLGPIGLLDGDGVRAAGSGLFWGGLVTTLVAQYAMGDSWRIGVDEGERTDLVTGGMFGVVRNPIYTAMFPAFVGIALLVPNPVSLVALAALLAGLEIQTRVVEEPHLLNVHGEAYASYAARVGRFFPGVGRIRRARQPTPGP